ncbi:flotillin family protein [Ensifer adhaerens]|uniref:SPFH domain-containing protein n=1 Tax=Ensifer adhaerens TaxID=106592 RepID=A0A9Q9DF10_ENSAD|nr:flotillin family protein [Ensifer adhaerens]USJ28492.1 SPFH domain-containing protein [Ensifer adhaerens]
MGVLATLIGGIIIAAVIIVILWILFWWLYNRATKEVAFVRTGLGNQKVVQTGGAFVIPVLHDLIRVSMGTVRLEISRSQEKSVITKDRMRVDVVAEFYVRVGGTPEAIALAAQSLGAKTARPEALRELLEGRFVDALRTVAAELTMKELHEQRGEYIRRVKALAKEEIARTGLELESASLTSLDQTNKEYFNPNNAFDAEGLTLLTTEIEERRRKRNAIEQDSEISIQRKNLETQTLKLQLVKDEEYARLSQEQEIAIRRAEQSAIISTEEARRRRESEEAKVASHLSINVTNVQANQKIELEKIASEQALDQQRHKTKRDVERTALDAELELKLHRIEREKVVAIQLAEQQAQIVTSEAAQRKAADEATIRANQEVDKIRVLSERDLELEKVEAERAIEVNRRSSRRDVSEAELAGKLAIDMLTLEHEKSLALTSHQKDIALAESAKAQIKSLSETEAERKTLIQVEEELTRIRTVQREERTKAVALIQATTKAESETITTVAAAEARRKEADELAKIAAIETQSRAGRVVAMATADAQAEKERSLAYEIARDIEARTMRSIIDAENAMSSELIEMKVRLSVVDNLRDIIRESARPMEAIDDIKIVHVGGLVGNGGSSSAHDAVGDTDNQNLASKVVDSALRYRAQAPIVDSLLKEIGLSALDSKGMSDMLQSDFGKKSKPNGAARPEN